MLILVTDGWGIYCKIALGWLPLDYICDKSTLVQVMAWCRQATSHYLSQCWPRSMSPCGITRPQCVNSSLPGQNGCHFTDNIFRCIFVNEQLRILIKILLKVVPKGPIDNIPALVEIMAWRRIGDKPLSEPMLSRFTDAYSTKGRSVNL